MNNTTTNPKLYYKINWFMTESTLLKAAFFLSCERLTHRFSYSFTDVICRLKGRKSSHVSPYPVYTTTHQFNHVNMNSSIRFVCEIRMTVLF